MWTPVMTCSWICKSQAYPDACLVRNLISRRSSPRSPNYGKHLSRREVIDLFAPENQAVEKVKRWLVSTGVEERRISQSPNKQVNPASFS
jgi:hypothetical protein